MLEAFKANVVLPVSTRLGMGTTGFLVGLGANAQHADWVGTGVAGVILVGVDLMLAWLRKRGIQNKARTAFLDEPSDVYREGPLK